MTSTTKIDSLLKVVSAWVSLPLLLLAASFELMTIVPEARATVRVAQIALVAAGLSLIASTIPRLRGISLLVLAASIAVLVALGLGYGAG